MMLMKTQLITFILVLGIPLCGLSQRNATSPAPAKPSSTVLQPRPYNGSDPGKNSTTPSGRPYREREDLPPGGSVFRMTQPPTFADHSEAAKAVEQTLPVQLPVAQMYNASPKLPGYLDATRSASFATRIRCSIASRVECVKPLLSARCGPHPVLGSRDFSVCFSSRV